MRWEKRAQRYLKSFGYEFLGVDDGYVVWQDKSGRVWESLESAFNYKMNGWDGNDESEKNVPDAKTIRKSD